MTGNGVYTAPVILSCVFSISPLVQSLLVLDEFDTDSIRPLNKGNLATTILVRFAGEFHSFCRKVGIGLIHVIDAKNQSD